MQVDIKGSVSSGFGQGKYFTQLDWVKEQFFSKLGFVPYPGTLNLDITKIELESLVRLFGRNGGVTIAPTDNSCCSAICFTAQINGLIEGAVVMPERTRHPKGRLEIIAPVNIRESLSLSDGDVVTLTFKKQKARGEK